MNTQAQPILSSFTSIESDYSEYIYNIKRKLEDEDYGESSNTRRKLNNENSTDSSELESESELESGSEPRSGSEPKSESESESEPRSESEPETESTGTEESNSDSCPSLGHSGNETLESPWDSPSEDTSHREWFEDIFLG